MIVVNNLVQNISQSQHEANEDNSKTRCTTDNSLFTNVFLKSLQHRYDMPFMEVTRPKIPARNQQQTPGSDEGENRFSLPSYAHMIVTDGQLEPHNYAIIRSVSRTSTICTKDLCRILASSPLINFPSISRPLYYIYCRLCPYLKIASAIRWWYRIYSSWVHMLS